MLNQTEVKKEVKETMKQVFVSYHYVAQDGSANGFGNYIGEFRAEDYMNDIKEFILQLESTIAYELDQKTGVPCHVKIMFFR